MEQVKEGEEREARALFFSLSTRRSTRSPNLPPFFPSPASHLAACRTSGRLAILPASGGARLYASGSGARPPALVAHVESPSALGPAAAWAPGGAAFAAAYADGGGGLLVLPALDEGGQLDAPGVSVPGGGGAAPVRALAWLLLLGGGGGGGGRGRARGLLLLALLADGALVARAAPSFDRPLTLATAAETGGAASALAVGTLGDGSPAIFLAGPGAPPGRLRASVWVVVEGGGTGLSLRLAAAAGAPPPAGWLAGLLGRGGGGSHSPPGWSASMSGTGLAAVAPAAGPLAVFALPPAAPLPLPPAEEDDDNCTPPAPAPLARLALTAPPGPDGEPDLPPWAAAPAGGLAWWGGGGAPSTPPLLASLSAAGDLAATAPPRTACVLEGGQSLALGAGARLVPGGGGGGGGGSSRLFVLSPASGRVTGVDRLDPPGASAAAMAAGDWEGALTITSKHGMDADTVHLARWAAVRPGRASAGAAAGTLGLLSPASRSAALAAALAATAPSARAQAELLAWVLTVLLRDDGAGVESGPPPPGWPHSAPPPPPHLWTPAARLAALRHRARLATLVDGLGGYTPAAYAALRDADLAGVLGDLAAAGDAGRCRALLTRHAFGLGGGGGGGATPHAPPLVLTALARLPETLPVPDVLRLLRLALATPPPPAPTDPAEEAGLVAALVAAGAGPAITTATEPAAAASGSWSPLSPSILAAWTADRAAAIDAATGQVQVAGGLASGVAPMVAPSDPAAAARLADLAVAADDLAAAAVGGAWAVGLAQYWAAGPADRARLLLCGSGGEEGRGCNSAKPSRFTPPPASARARAAAALASLTPADRTATLGALIASQPLDWAIGLVGVEAAGPRALFASRAELASAVVAAVDALPPGAHWLAAAELVAEARAAVAPEPADTVDEEEEEEGEDASEEDAEESATDDDASLPRSASGSCGGDGWAGEGGEDDATPAADVEPSPDDADADALAFHRLGVTAALVDAARCLDEWLGGGGGGGGSEDGCSDAGGSSGAAAPLSVSQLRTADPATLWARLAAVLGSLEGPPPAGDGDWTAAVGDMQGVAGAVAAALADGPGGPAAAVGAISAETIAAQAAAGALRCCRWRAARALLAQLDPANAEAAALAGGRHHLGRAAGLGDEAVADAAACHALVPHPGGPAAAADRAALAALRRLGDYGADLAPGAFFAPGADRMAALAAAVEAWPAAPRHPDAVLALADQLGLGPDRADEVRLRLADAAAAGGDEGAAARLTSDLVRSGYGPAWRAAARLVRCPPDGLPREEVRAALAFALAHAPVPELGGLLAAWDGVASERSPLGEPHARLAAVQAALLKAGTSRLRAALERVGQPPPVGGGGPPPAAPSPLPSVGDAVSALGWLCALAPVGGARVALEAASGLGGETKAAKADEDGDEATSGALPPLAYPPLQPAPARAAALLGMFHAALEVLAPPVVVGGSGGVAPPPSPAVPPDLAARLATPAPALWAAAAERAARPPPPPAAALAAGVAWAERAAADADARVLRAALGPAVDAARWADPAQVAYREAALVEAAVRAAADAAAAEATGGAAAVPLPADPSSLPPASNPASPVRARAAVCGAPPALAPILAVARRSGVDGWAATAAYAAARLAGLGSSSDDDPAAARDAARSVRDEVRALRRRLVARPAAWLDALMASPWAGLARGHGPQLALWLAAAEDAAGVAAAGAECEGEGAPSSPPPASASQALVSIRKAVAAAGRAVPSLDGRALAAPAVADALGRPALLSSCGAATLHPPASAAAELLAAATPDAAPELARAVAGLPGRAAGGEPGDQVRPDDVRLAAACRALAASCGSGEDDEAAADRAYSSAARAMAGAGAAASAAFARVCVLGEAPPPHLAAAGVPGRPPGGLPPRVRARAAADAAAALERGVGAGATDVQATLTAIQAASSTARALCALRDGGARLTPAEVTAAEAALEERCGGGGAPACLEALVAAGCPAGRLVAAARALDSTLGGTPSAEDAVDAVLGRALEEAAGQGQSLLAGVRACLAASGPGSGAPPPQLGAMRDAAWARLADHCFGDGSGGSSTPPRRDVLRLVAALAASPPSAPWSGWAPPGSDGEGASPGPRLAAATMAALPRAAGVVTPAELASPAAAAACFARLLGGAVGAGRAGRRSLACVLCGVWGAGAELGPGGPPALAPCFDALLAAMVEAGDDRDAVALADRLAFSQGDGDGPAVPLSPAIAARVRPPCLAAAMAVLLAPAGADGATVAAAALATPHTLLDRGDGGGGPGSASPGAPDLLASLAARGGLAAYVAAGGGGGDGAVEDALVALAPPVWDGTEGGGRAEEEEEDGWASAASEGAEAGPSGTPPLAWPGPPPARPPPWTAVLPPHALAALIAGGEPERGAGLAAAHARVHPRTADLDCCLGLGLAYLRGHVGLVEGGAGVPRAGASCAVPGAVAAAWGGLGGAVADGLERLRADLGMACE